MKPPKCRVCHVEEWQHVCAKDEDHKPAAAVTYKRNAQPKPVTHTPAPVTHRTNADRQRAYRQAHADQYRASNRQRMAKARAEAEHGR